MDKNTTSRFPSSINVPSVGQSLAAKLDDDGEYANESRPAAWNTVAYSDGARLSELTIKRETTVGAMSPSAVHQ